MPGTYYIFLAVISGMHGNKTSFSLCVCVGQDMKSMEFRIHLILCVCVGQDMKSMEVRIHLILCVCVGQDMKPMEVFSVGFLVDNTALCFLGM